MGGGPEIVRRRDREDARIGEVGYLLAARARGRGVVTRAVRLLVSWSFSAPLSMARLQALTHPGNARSASVLERCGFRREGVLRSYREEPSGREDRVMWSLLPIDSATP